ncbi:kinase-like domain-containing protein [Trichoderma ceciliae]
MTEKRITQIFIDPSLKPQNLSQQSSSTERALPQSRIPRLKRNLPRLAPLASGDEAQPSNASVLSVSIKQHPGNPWAEYREVLKVLNFEGTVSLAIRKRSPRAVVNIREYPGEKAAETLFTYSQLHHINIVSIVEAFCTPEMLYIAFEWTQFSLEQIIQCPIYPTIAQLAAILGQILDGLCYLENKDFAHGNLTCRNVHLSLQGVVKLASQESFYKLTNAMQIKDILAVKATTLRLMQKNKNPGITTNLWASHQTVIDFVAAIDSETPVTKLRRRLNVLIYANTPIQLNLVKEDNAISSNKNANASLSANHNNNNPLAPNNDDCRVITRHPLLDDEGMSQFMQRIFDPNLFMDPHSHMPKDDVNENILILLSAEPSVRDSLRQRIRATKKNITLKETDYQPK